MSQDQNKGIPLTHNRVTVSLLNEMKKKQDDAVKEEHKALTNADLGLKAKMDSSLREEHLAHEEAEKVERRMINAAVIKVSEVGKEEDPKQKYLTVKLKKREVE